MTDKELLTLAAKAAGYVIEWERDLAYPFQERWCANLACGVIDGMPQWREWNPLREGGDALRLAVKLRITISYRGNAADCFTVPEQPENSWPHHVQPWGGDAGDDAAATRRAIVRAAAAIGETK